MLNMKKGLAIVLAAATALTFAPVSTLGLQGVVEAQAAETAKIGLDKDSLTAGSSNTVKVNALSVPDAIANSDVYTLYIAKSVTALSAAAENATPTATDAGSSDKIAADTTTNIKAVTFTVAADGAGSSQNLLDAVDTSGISFAIASPTAGDYYVVLSKSTSGGTETVIGATALPCYATNPIELTKGHSTVTGLDLAASFGKTESFKVKADDGYQVDTVTYSYTSGSDTVNKVLTADKDGNYSFTMPNATDVSVVVTTSKTATPAPTSAVSKFTTGGVLASVPAYDGATFDLIENAAISYKGVNYDKKDLTWYLSSSPVTTGTAREPVNVKPTSTNGSIKAGKGVLSITATKTEDLIKELKGTTANSVDLYAVATYAINGAPTVVSSSKVTVKNLLKDTAFSSAKAVKASANDVNVTVAASQTKPTDPNKTILDSVNITNPENYNKYVDDYSTVTLGDTDEVYETGTNFTLDAKKNNKKPDRAIFKGSELKQNNDLSNGTYHETVYVPYMLSGSITIYLLKVNVTASVSTGPKFRVVDNGLKLVSTYAGDTVATDPTVYLDLKTNKTFDIAAHTTTDIAGTTYKYESDSSNVTVDDKGVVTAKSVGPANIKITPKAGNVEGDSATLKVLVNANPFANFTVTGKDSDTADVLNAGTYNNNVTRLKDEKALAAAQVKYIQIEDNGTETSDIKENIKTSTVATGASLSYVFAATNSNEYKGMVIDAQTGEITVPYGVTELKKIQNEAFAVKVVSSGTSAFEATTGYFYFVVDYSDATVSGLQNAYTVGTDKGLNQETAINFSNEVKGAPVIGYEALRNVDDALKGDTTLYADESRASYNTSIPSDYSQVLTSQKSVIVDDATATGKVMYVLVDFQTPGVALKGHTYRIVKLTSAEGKTNTVTKIVNTDTNEVLFDIEKDTTRAPQLKIEDVTHLTVTLRYPVKENNTKFLIYNKNDDGSVVNQKYFVTAVKDDEVSVTLYPNAKGSDVIFFTPSGNISATDRTITQDVDQHITVTYVGGVVKPSKVTGLKVANKKGAAVSVSWKSQGKNILYRVYKKVGSGKWVAKNVAGTKTSLKVKKGAKVTVKVKAYKKTDAGKTVWGPKATQVTKKTDKK